MNTGSILNTPRPWAFSRSELTAGLRRYTGDPTLRIVELEEQVIPDLLPSVGRIRGIKVTCQGTTGQYTYELVLKEALQAGTTRAGTATPGQRETGFYRDLADQVPVRIPRVFAMDPMGSWLVMERLVGGKRPEQWKKEDYLLATAQMAVLHDRFWNLGRDLGVYSWLSRPIEADFEVNIKVASNALERLATDPGCRLFVYHAGLENLLRRMIQHADQIATGLRRAPDTLLHGDYWAANIHVDQQGRLTVFDWQQIGIGPGILDLLGFIQTSRWWFDPLPVNPDAMMAEYRRNLSEKTGTIWANREWQNLLDNAMMWLFMVNWLDTLASTPGPILDTRMQLLEDLWLKPIQECATRHLPAD